VRAPDFLDLPPREDKPRAHGLTHVLDNGLPTEHVAAALGSAGSYVDVWKLGWGTAYLDRGLEEKLRLLAAHDVRACLGGTLLEIAYARGKAADCLAWAADAGFPSVEVSCGTVHMPPGDKQELLRRASRQFVVLSEVGRKRREDALAPSRWPEEAAADLEAGAALVVAEGRDSGTVGIYGAAGEVHEDIVASLVERVGLTRVLFEAPRKDQQSWFIRRYGPDVNLGNIAVADVLALETLRLGLRSDTASLVTSLAVPRSEAAR
jgi:phosphosulfolactate synthase